MRLGDTIDDHCSRCKRTTDHAIVAIAGDEVVKVLCRTCNSEHKYRHNKTGKKEMTTEEAFQKVLANVTGQMGGASESGPVSPKKKTGEKSK
jgi:hypothetical protein